MWCFDCDHSHQGPALGFICIGCPCPKRPGDRSILDAKIAAEDAAIVDKPVPVLPGQLKLFE